MDETKIYPVLSNVRHNGTLYAPDTKNNQIELTDKEFISLKAVGCVGEALETPDQDDALTDEQVSSIKTTIELLDLGKDFTKAGNPKVAAVNEVLDFEATSAQINAVWETIKPKADE